MKERFKMNHVYKRGVGNIFGHILANVTGTYGKFFGTESVFREEKPYEKDFLLTLQINFCKI